MFSRSIKLLLPFAVALGFVVSVRAEQLLAYKLEISNSYITVPGQSVSSTVGYLGGGGSVLEQWDDASRPFVRITNVSQNPLLNLFGAELDLCLSASRITGVQWVEGSGISSLNWNWNWDEVCNSAVFQFEDPLGPGGSVLMRLSTAPRSGLEMDYKQNQTLFHPALGNCLEVNDSCGIFVVYSQRTDSTTPVVFDASGRPTAPDLITLTTPLDRPLTPAEYYNPTGEIVIPLVVPVPEPDTIVMAAAAALAGIAIRGRPSRRQAA